MVAGSVSDDMYEVRLCADWTLVGRTGRSALSGLSSVVGVGWIGLQCAPLGDAIIAATLVRSYGPVWAAAGGVMSLWRQSPAQSVGGVPVMSQANRALWRERIRALGMYRLGSV